MFPAPPSRPPPSLALFLIDPFTTTYDADQQILRAHWAQPLPDDQMQATLLALLSAARAHGPCRFWLLDIRQRPLASPALQRWAREVLHPQLTAGLAGPVFAAFVVAPGQRPAVESPAMDAHLRAAVTDNLYPYYFETEAAALDWLHHQQQQER